MRKMEMLLSVFLILLFVACGRSAPTGVESGSSGSPAEEKAPSVTRVARSALPTLVSSPTPAYSGTYTGTPTPDPTPVEYGTDTDLESYVVQPGETLSLIASVFGCTIEEIVAANNLTQADTIRVGQTLYIPTHASEVGPSMKLVPDSELVYGPAYISFDLAGFVAKQDGHLAHYSEYIEGEDLTGVEVVALVARRFSVGPRVLLTLLEMESGWVTQREPAPALLSYPLGHVQEQRQGLFKQLSWAAMRLNEGYYGWKWGRSDTVRLGDGTRVAVAPDVNAGTVGVQNCLAALTDDFDQWLAKVGEDGFLAFYRQLFGNPFTYTVDPLLPPDLEQPEMRLPWEGGETWYFTGGPHGGWGEAHDRSALDFAPEGGVGCVPSSAWATAAASGLVVHSGQGEVLIDLDGDGFVQSGWVLFYLHIYAEDRVAEGAYVEQGERIGHPSCEGGAAEAMHLHIARRYNGEWIPAGTGLAPMVLSGWRAHEAQLPYDGLLTSGEEERTACECWDDEINGLTSDNFP